MAAQKEFAFQFESGETVSVDDLEVEELTRRTLKKNESGTMIYTKETECKISPACLTGIDLYVHSKKGVNKGAPLGDHDYASPKKEKEPAEKDAGCCAPTTPAAGNNDMTTQKQTLKRSFESMDMSPEETSAAVRPKTQNGVADVAYYRAMWTQYTPLNMRMSAFVDTLLPDGHFSAEGGLLCTILTKAFVNEMVELVDCENCGDGKLCMQHLLSSKQISNMLDLILPEIDQCAILASWSSQLVEVMTVRAAFVLLVTLVMPRMKRFWWLRKWRTHIISCVTQDLHGARTTGVVPKLMLAPYVTAATRDAAKYSLLMTEDAAEPDETATAEPNDSASV